MKKIIYIAICLSSLFSVSCKRELSLQRYFVENSGSKDFISLDVSPATLISGNSDVLTAKEKAIFNAYKKINILAFKANDSNHSKFEEENAKVETILKHEKYQSLIDVGQGKDGFSLRFIGDEDHIREFVLFVNQERSGFAIIRVLGKDMNPTQFMKIIDVLNKLNSDIPHLKLFENISEK